MKYLKTWTGYNPNTEKEITRMKIIEGAKNLSYEMETQKDEVFYKLTEENVGNLKIAMMNELQKQKDKRVQQEIYELHVKMEMMAKHIEHLEETMCR